MNEMEHLEPTFREKVDRVLADCKANGYDMQVFETLRTPWEQARLWRQSRTGWEISKQIDELDKAGADFLAAVIDEVGPQVGPEVTGVIPGYSFHQWGLAVDCVLVVDGKAVWRLEKANGAYEFYARQAHDHGIYNGGLMWGWDWYHVQDQRASIHEIYTLMEVNEAMRDAFQNSELG